MKLIFPSSTGRWVALACLCVLLASCGRNMYNQPKYEVYEASDLFENGTSARELPANTVSRDRGSVNASFFTGTNSSGLLSEPPFEVTEDVLLRGQQRYNIYCSPCHNFNGNGQGMIVQKGFVMPSSFHEQRLRDQPIGYFYNVMTNGYGRMYSYASRIPPEDRWAIASYVRALQYSQNAPEMALTEAQRLDLGLNVQEASR